MLDFIIHVAKRAPCFSFVSYKRLRQYDIILQYSVVFERRLCLERLCSGHSKVNQFWFQIEAKSFIESSQRLLTFGGLLEEGGFEGEGGHTLITRPLQDIAISAQCQLLWHNVIFRNVPCQKPAAFPPTPMSLTPSSTHRTGDSGQRHDDVRASIGHGRAGQQKGEIFHVFSSLGCLKTPQRGEGGNLICDHSWVQL